MLTISGLLNGDSEQGRGLWWGAMAEKIDAAIRGGEISYREQEPQREIARQFWQRYTANEPPPSEDTRVVMEQAYPRGAQYYEGNAEKIRKYGSGPKGAFEGFLAAVAAKRKGPTAEKCLEIAENQLAKGNKKMAYLWAMRAIKTATAEKKPAIQKRAEELAQRLKAEMAAQAVAGFLGEDMALSIPPALSDLLDRMISRGPPYAQLGLSVAMAFAARDKAQMMGIPAVKNIAARMAKAAQIATLVKRLGL